MTKVIWKYRKRLLIEDWEKVNWDELQADTMVICPSCGLEAHIHNTSTNVFISCSYCDMAGIGAKYEEVK